MVLDIPVTLSMEVGRSRVSIRSRLGVARACSVAATDAAESASRCAGGVVLPSTPCPMLRIIPTCTNEELFMSSCIVVVFPAQIQRYCDVI